MSSTPTAARKAKANAEDMATPTQARHPHKASDSGKGSAFRGDMVSLKEWGELMTTRETYGEAKEYVRQLNVALSRFPLTLEEMLAIEFTIKSVMKTRRDGKVLVQKTHYIYAKNLPQRWKHGRRAS